MSASNSRLSASGSVKKTACDRCRTHKLRCERDQNLPEQNLPCPRCSRAGTRCTTSPPMKLGRPPKTHHQWDMPVEQEIDENMSAALSLAISTPNNIDAVPSSFHYDGSSPASSKVAYSEGSPIQLGYHDMASDHGEKRGYSLEPHQQLQGQLPFESSASLGFRFSSEPAAASTLPQDGISFSHQADQFSAFADAMDMMSGSEIPSSSTHPQLPRDSVWSDEPGDMDASLRTTGEEEHLGKQLSCHEDFIPPIPQTSISVSPLGMHHVARLSMYEPRIDKEYAQNGCVSPRPGEEKGDIIQTLSALLSRFSHLEEGPQDGRPCSFRMASETSNDFLNALDRLSSHDKHDHETTQPEVDASTTLLLIGCYIKLVPLLNKVCKMLSQKAEKRNRRAGTHLDSADSAMALLPDLGMMHENDGLKVFLFLQTITYILSRAEKFLVSRKKDTNMMQIIHSAKQLEETAGSFAEIHHNIQTIRDLYL